MALEEAIADSLLLDRCREEQRNGIYRASDGRRVYFLWRGLGKGLVVEDFQNFMLVQYRYQSIQNKVWQVAAALCLATQILAARGPGSPLYWSVVVTAIAVNSLVGCWHAYALSNKFPRHPDGPSRALRRAQRRAAARGELPAPLRKA